MSILTNPLRKIDPKILKDHGFWKSGWGSPITRATKNTDMWTAIKGRLEIKWFPEGWEGVAYCGHTPMTTELWGRCWITDAVGRDYLSPVLDNFDEILMFIEQYKDFHFTSRSTFP